MKSVSVILMPLIPVFILAITSGCTPMIPKQGPMLPGTYEMKADMVTGGFPRKSLIHIPREYNPSNPHPLLVVVHGAFSNGREIAERTGFSKLADREGIIVLYPEGIGIFGYLQHWNAGHCCGKAEKEGIDDIGFLDAAMEKVIRRFSVDPKRIFLVGHSNGGMLAFRYAAQHPEKLAAVAAVSAALNSKKDDRKTFPILQGPQTPLPICIIHGVADESIPYAGGKMPDKHKDRTFSSVAEAADYWVKGNGCQNPPEEIISYGGRVKRLTWQVCSGDARVVLYAIEQWGHAWPSRHVISSGVAKGKPFDFDAADVIWEFFATQGRH